MENIIKKAIEGGYLEKARISFDPDNGKAFFIYPDDSHSEYVKWSEFTTSRSFWNGLAKALNWIDEDGDSVAKYINNDPKHTQKDMWPWHALRFHEISLTEGFDKAIEWLENIIK